MYQHFISAQRKRGNKLKLRNGMRLNCNPQTESPKRNLIREWEKAHMRMVQPYFMVPANYQAVVALSYDEIDTTVHVLVLFI